ncbi:hypothetical protein ALC60_11540 [Trachymyrmex zeteki]|uniref:Uncharacterized protein n=1 Tax=Mycetomoellerius zeteki TaxID=64791 RepID=A0A151WNI8_9HYME|nr:hypothetical protein ALC60_11540 [Trachymyrmex zeteki]
MNRPLHQPVSTPDFKSRWLSALRRDRWPGGTRWDLERDEMDKIIRRVGRIWRTGGRMPAPGAAVEGAPDVGVPVPPGLAAAGAAGLTSREALSPSPRLCVPATTRYTVPAALAAPSAAC